MTKRTVASGGTSPRESLGLRPCEPYAQRASHTNSASSPRFIVAIPVSMSGRSKLAPILMKGLPKRSREFSNLVPSISQPS